MSSKMSVIIISHVENPDPIITKVDPNNNHHTLIRSKQRRCKICHKIRRWSCSICDVGVCQRECFLKFHENFLDYKVFVEKFKCFGKNHRARVNGYTHSNIMLLEGLTNIAQNISTPTFGFKPGSYESVSFPSSFSINPNDNGSTSIGTVHQSMINDDLISALQLSRDPPIPLPNPTVQTSGNSGDLAVVKMEDPSELT